MKQYKCNDCGFETGDEKAMETHLYGIQHLYGKKGDDGNKVTNEAAMRDDIEPRYDLIIPEFEKAMAQVLAVGAKHYGDTNYQNSRLTGNRSPINHIKHHLQLYQADISYNHSQVGPERRNHLVAIAVNAMMEYFYELKGM